VFDTAPTGHTLRLLSLPQAWSSFVETSTTGTSCLGPLAGLQDQQALYQASVAVLADPTRTTLFLVSRPENTALREAERTRLELCELGVANQRLILNGLFQAIRSDDPVAMAFARRGREALDTMAAGLDQLPRLEVRLSSRALIGVPALRAMFKGDIHDAGSTVISPGVWPMPPSLRQLVDDLERDGKGVIMTMGKGGVGKTTVAAAIAVELARRGHSVRLTTTDPAAHVGWSMVDPPPGLSVGRIAAAEETAHYRREVMTAVGESLDESGRALLEEDLRSPCTEEVALFRAFARTVAEGQDGFVILDTAPTGHTILLLDAALAYHREVSRQASGVPDSVRDLLPRLRDPAFTRIVLVALPEATPVHEAARLQADLARANLRPFAWVINQTLAPLTTTDPILRRRQANERRYIDEVTGTHADRVVLVPWLSEPPVGGAGLRALLDTD